MDYSITVSDEAFRYLVLQRGSINDLKGDRGAWERAYRDSLSDSYYQMANYLPPTCQSILDVGAGLGGIDILLARHYVLAQGYPPFIALFDGENDPPVMIRHRKTFSDRTTAGNFQSDNRVLIDYRSPKDMRPLPMPAQLVISTGAWCFHFPPEEYLEWVRNNTGRPAVIIIDVRTDKAEWHSTLEHCWQVGPIIFRNSKRTRRVFYA